MPASTVYLASWCDPASAATDDTEGARLDDAAAASDSDCDQASSATAVNDDTEMPVSLIQQPPVGATATSHLDCQDR